MKQPETYLTNQELALDALYKITNKDYIDPQTPASEVARKNLMDAIILYTETCTRK